jgi:Protein of unknown function (DUF3102)
MTTTAKEFFLPRDWRALPLEDLRELDLETRREAARGRHLAPTEWRRLDRLRDHIEQHKQAGAAAAVTGVTPDKVTARARAPDDSAIYAPTPEPQLMNTTITSETAALGQHAKRIRELGKMTVANIIEIGKRLSECRTILKEDGKWRAWLETEFCFSYKTADNFINVSGCEDVFTWPDLPVSALYLLAAPSTPAEARDEIIERASAGETVTVAGVKETIGRTRHPPAPSGEMISASEVQAAQRTFDEHDASSEGEDVASFQELAAMPERRAPRRSSEQIQKDDFLDSISIVLSACKCAGKHPGDLSPKDIPPLGAAESKELLKGIKDAITALEKLHERIKKASAP